MNLKWTYLQIIIDKVVELVVAILHIFFKHAIKKCFFYIFLKLSKYDIQSSATLDTLQYQGTYHFYHRFDFYIE